MNNSNMISLNCKKEPKVWQLIQDIRQKTIQHSTLQNVLFFFFHSISSLFFFRAPQPSYSLLSPPFLLLVFFFVLPSSLPSSTLFFFYLPSSSSSFLMTSTLATISDLYLSHLLLPSTCLSSAYITLSLSSLLSPPRSPSQSQISPSLFESPVIVLL